MQFKPSKHSSYGEADSGQQDLTAAIVAKIVDPDPHFRVERLKARIRTLENLIAKSPRSPMKGLWKRELQKSKGMLTAAERAAGVQESEEGIFTAAQAATWGVAILTAAGTIYLISRAVRGT